MPTPKKTKNAKNAIRSFNKRMTSKLPKVRTVRNYTRPISRVEIANMMRLAARARKPPLRSTKRNR